MSSKLLTVTKNHLFRRAYSKGTPYVSQSVAVYVLKSGREASRVGITVSTKRGNAVVRSRTRRIIREALRELMPSVIPGRILIVVARQGAVGKKSTQISGELSLIFKKAGLLVSEARS